MSQVLAEMDANLTPKTLYTYAGGQVLKEEPGGLNRTQDLYYLPGESVGSIAQATNMSGAVVDEYDYDAFGMQSVLKKQSASLGHKGYTGQDYDPESGLVYLRARYYDPRLGRFISVDPYNGTLDQPQTQNKYAYAGGNPVSYNDPSGLCGPLTGFCVWVIENAFAINTVGIAGSEAVAGVSIGVAGGAAIAGSVANKPFAMGIEPYLDDFAMKNNATTWKQFDDVTNWKPQVLDNILDPNQKVLFNLDGVDVWPGVSRAASGFGGAADWELLQIRQNPQAWDTIEFFLDGTKVENPFQCSGK